MKLFRLRFILLGLFVCVCDVWSLTCRTEFDDIASSAYIADVVIVGNVEQKLQTNGNYRYSIRVSIKTRRHILKGVDHIPKQVQKRRDSLLISYFGDEDRQKCLTQVDKDTNYIFFLNSTGIEGELSVSAFPVSEKNQKEYKKGLKDIKKILCNKDNCVKPPQTDTRRGMKDGTLEIGSPLELNCKLKTRVFPPAIYRWTRNGADVSTLKIKGLSIKNSKKGSRLKIRKAGLSDVGRYDCSVKNVGGTILQQSVITMARGDSLQLPSRVMKNKKQKFGKSLKLNCKIKPTGVKKPTFTWYKDGSPIVNGKKEGFAIKNRRTESRLRKKKTYLSDAGTYTCNVTNGEKTLTQTSVVTVVGEPPKLSGIEKRIPCEEKDKDYCYNNGTCEIMVEIDRRFCSCPPDYRGTKCEEFVYDEQYRRIQEGEEKLAQDRNLIIIGIISGILVFIGICVASYFLAKRRRDRFHSRRRHRQQNIEDNIPQVYRPLLGCDEIDGLKKQANGVVHRETQTTESCFLGSGKANLYINPLEGYIRHENEDKSPRSRKTAVSLEGYPKPEPRDLQTQNNPRRCKSDSNDRHPNNPKNKDIDRSHHNLEPDGAPREVMNDLSTRNANDRKPSARPTGANTNVPNIPSSVKRSSINAPVLNLDTDSDDDIPIDNTPLTPLHISEDEDNNTFKKVKPRPNKNANNDANKKRENTKDNYPPDYNTAAHDYKAVATDKHYDSDASKSNDSDDSSTTTEGCDSPSTAFRNAQSFSDPALNEAGHWNERGSPEPKQKANPNFFQFPKMGDIKNKRNAQQDPAKRNGNIRSEQERNQRLRGLKTGQKPIVY